MSGPGGAGPDPPLTGGEFLLSLLQKSNQHQQQHHHHHHHQHQQQQSHQVQDPSIVAAFGPYNNNSNNWSPLPPNGLPGSNQPRHQWSHIPTHFLGFTADGTAPALRNSDSGGSGFRPRQEPLLTFGSFPAPIHNGDALLNWNLMNSWNVGLSSVPMDFDRNGARPPPGFVGAGRGVGRRDLFKGDLAEITILEDSGLGKQLDHPGPPAGSTLHSVGASDVEESMLVLHANVGGESKNSLTSKDLLDDDDEDEIEELSDKIGDSLGIDDDEVDDNSKKFIKSRCKEARSDTRGQKLLNQKQKIHKRHSQTKRRAHICKQDAPLIAIYDSLIPSEEEKAQQKQLFGLLERLVNREWTNAKLYIYGSCANSFGVSKSDIDVCFMLEGADNNKPEILSRLAEILESDNFKNVQALVTTRVPIVKLMDPATEISCDICINNRLAVVNTKLLRDYAQIDLRLRQLAFIVKHWAKSRRVNNTYHGTLSSYAYVLMCINFLQQRRPAILPCLQEMETTYSVTIENVHCAFFDRVDRLQGFGHQNNESISQLVWSFFHYWAYVHDYAKSVLSVRTGTLLSKKEKDWNKRIGIDRHLICIEDPFETSYDLGRSVDKRSIKVIKEEFERAAEVLHNDPNPFVKLFEPYVPS